MGNRCRCSLQCGHTCAAMRNQCSTMEEDSLLHGSTMKVTAQGCINYATINHKDHSSEKSGDKAIFSCIVPQNAAKSLSSHNTLAQGCRKRVTGGISSVPQIDRRYENLDADWPGGCVTFSASLFGRPHCVNTCSCARPTSSVPISLVCWSIVDKRIYIYHKLCDESNAVEKLDIRCQLLML